MCLTKKVCPVPFDQQPLNEFYALKKSCFFSIFGFRLSQYIYAVLIICLIIILLSTFPILLTFNFSWYIFLINELLCITVFLSFILVRLYLGWSYIIHRLFSATIFYEESGWYDGQLWIKTAEMLTKDRLVATYYVLPVLQRIKFTFAILFVGLIIDISCYRLICW